MVHRSSLRGLICRAEDQFIFSYTANYLYTCCPLPDPDVGPSVFVFDVEHTSFHFGLCGHKFFFAVLVLSVSRSLHHRRHSWQHTGVVHMYLQARLRLKRSRCLAYAIQLAMVLRCTSLSCMVIFHETVYCCPKYTYILQHFL